jgi:pyrroloquinoline quinone (PQQ) biosynthesis protein C
MDFNKVQIKNDILMQIDCLKQDAIEHRAVNHPYIIALANGKYSEPLGPLRDFAIQYQGYVAWFPKYLSALISKLDKQQHKLWLINNLNEESGVLEEQEIKMLEKIGIKKEWVQGIPHPELFRRFQQALNIKLNSNLSDAVHVWRESLYNTISKGSVAKAIGAMGLGTESIVKYIYRYVTDGISKHTSLTREDYVFFELHSEIDNNHSDSMLQIAVDLIEENPNNYFEIKTGMIEALNQRSIFWDKMYARAKTIDFFKNADFGTIG